MNERHDDLPEAGYNWRYLLGIALLHRRELILAHIVAIAGALLSVPIPLLMPLLVDEVLLDKPAVMVETMNRLFPSAWHGPVLYIVAVLLFALLMRLGSLLLGVWQTRQFTAISKDITYRIRRELLLRLRRVSMAEYETVGSGAVASHLVTDLDSVDLFVGMSVSRFLVAVLSIVGTALVLLWMNWQLAVVILAMNPVVIYLTTVLGRKVKRLKKRENEAYEGFQRNLGETLDAIQQIRASNREGFYIGRVIDQADAIKRHSTAFAWKSDAANRLSFVVFLFGFDAFRALSMFMVLFSGLSIGQMLAVFAYLWFMMGPVQEILGIQYSFHAAQAALGRINRLVHMDREPEYPHIRNPFEGTKTTSIRLENLNFAYGDGPAVLKNVSLTIAPGEKVALVGASGGGKTTLVQVLLGLYPARSGQVYYGGVPVTEVGMDVVRDHVATVLQHPVLFNDSVRMNLTLGRDIPDEQLWRAIDIAQLREVIEKLDQGLETIIGRQGVRLSGGQRQRVAIARMVLTDPKIVILDEATSALDAEVEGRVHQALHDFLQGRTTVIIAHRLSAVRQADRALVFDDGRIIEEGRHETLLENDGLYARLYGSQGV